MNTQNKFFKSSHLGKITILLLLLPLSYFAIYPSVLYFLYTPKEADIVFQSLSRSSDLVRAIEGVTQSEYSHCGVVLLENDKWVVIEALGTVIKTPLFKWLARGRGHRMDVFRLKSEYHENISNFKASLNQYLGRPYDFRYRLDDEKIYCSELPYKAYLSCTGVELAKLEELNTLNWKPYVKTIEKYEHGKIPLNRKMITPINLSQSDYLEPVIKLGF